MSNQDGRIIKDVKDSLDKAISDLSESMQGVVTNFKRDWGIGLKEIEAIKKAAANEAMVDFFRGQCKLRLHWLQLLLGIRKVRIPKHDVGGVSKIPMGVGDVLDNSKESRSIDKEDGKFCFSN